MSDLLPITGTSQTLATESSWRLLVLSNGHGEDAIALRILHELQQQTQPLKLFALPLVGEGRAYQKLNVPLIGSVRAMPSGGFIYMDGRELVRDVRGGLLQLTLDQIKAVRSWVAQKNKNDRVAILAVGDIVPLLFAWASGCNYAFVGTAKSEYYLRDETGWLQRQTRAERWEGWAGSVYLPWERWLMSRRRCQAVFPRDSLTTEVLQKWRIPAFDLGNPMMDGLEPSVPQQFFSRDFQQQEMSRPMVITLLPGSRPPEAYANWEKIMVGVSTMFKSPYDRHTSGNLIFLGAIAPGLDCDTFAKSLTAQGWQSYPQSPLNIPDAQALTFKQKNAYLILTQNAYNDCLHLGDVAIAMAGTATEQFVGLGKPAITIPGEGPQFTPKFAEAQSRHLGVSVSLVEPEEVGEIVRSLLWDPDKLHAIAKNGLRRMGEPGAASRIAQCLIEKLG